MHIDFCPKAPIGNTLHSVGEWLGPKAKETEAGSPYTLRLCGVGVTSPWKRSLVSHSQGFAPSSTCLSFRISQCLSVLSVCLSFALVEVYTDPAHIRGGGGLHLVWTLRGMGARGDMVWGSGEVAAGWWLEITQRVGS